MWYIPKRYIFFTSRTGFESEHFQLTISVHLKLFATVNEIDLHGVFWCLHGVKRKHNGSQKSSKVTTATTTTKARRKKKQSASKQETSFSAHQIQCLEKLFNLNCDLNDEIQLNYFINWIGISSSCSCMNDDEHTKSLSYAHTHFSVNDIWKILQISTFIHRKSSV